MEKPFILIVDDDEANIDALKEVMEDRFGSGSLVTAQTKREAWDQFRRHRSRLVIIFIDYFLGAEGNGVDLVERIRRSGYERDLIALTAGTDARANELIQHGCNDKLLKPFSLEDLYVLVERALIFAERQELNPA